MKITWVVDLTDVIMVLRQIRSGEWIVLIDRVPRRGKNCSFVSLWTLMFSVIRRWSRSISEWWWKEFLTSIDPVWRHGRTTRCGEFWRPLIQSEDMVRQPGEPLSFWCSSSLDYEAASQVNGDESWCFGLGNDIIPVGSFHWSYWSSRKDLVR
jgi:hypothetical protein